MKYLILLALVCIYTEANAGFCTMQLEEEANVFEVNCALDLSSCSVTGYFTHPKLAPGYNGLVAYFWRPPEEFSKKSLNENISLLIRTYRNGEPKIKIPKGYFVAMEAAERVMIGEMLSELRYFDAVTGKKTSRPELECVPVE